MKSHRGIETCRVEERVFRIESGDETVRNGLLKKGVSDEDIHRTARLLKKVFNPFPHVTIW